MNLRRLLRAVLPGREGFFNALAAMLAVVLPIVLTLSAWNAARDDAAKEARLRFEFRAAQMEAAITGRMANYEQVLRGAAGLFDASISIERSEWRSYYNALMLDAYYPGIQGMGYAQYFSHPAYIDFVARVRGEGFPDFVITPPGQRERYAPILYLEPFSGRNLRAFGYDMYSETVRRDAMDRAMHTGSASITGKVTLVQETGADVQAGFLMYKPVYREAPAVPGQAVPQGFVYAVFRAGDLIKGVLGEERDIGIAIHDGSTLDRGALLYESRGITGRQPLFSTTSSVVLHDHIWTLRLVSLPEFEATVDKDKPRLVLLGGLAIGLLLVAVLWSLWTTRARALRLARTMTREVRQRQAELEAMNNASPLGIFRADPDGSCVYVNRRFESICGTPATASLGQGWVNNVHPDDRVRVATEWDKAVQKKMPASASTYRIQQPEGRIIWVRAKAAPMVEDGNVVGYVGSIEDITQLREKEEELRESRERLGLALEGSNLAIFDWDIPTGKVHLSEPWQGMLGGERRPTNTTINELQAMVHPDDLEKLQGKLSSVLKGEARFYEIEHRVKSNDGTWLWILSRAKVTERDARSRALRITGTNADITESKEIERLKNEFIATVSHELRTPLTAIIGALGLLKEDSAKLDEQSAVFLDMAFQNSERLAALINDVLDLEKIESGGATLDLKPLQLRAVLEKAVAINRPYADIHKVRLQLLPGADFTVAADADRLLQVMANLISNAAKFSPDDSEVEVSAEQHDGMVRVAVRDHGAGIPENFRDLIFQRFERADNSDTRKKGGTGLGLSICKALIERMLGRIGFETETGKGSTFYFELPLAGGGDKS